MAALCGTASRKQQTRLWLLDLARSWVCCRVSLSLTVKWGTMLLIYPNSMLRGSIHKADLNSNCNMGMVLIPFNILQIFQKWTRTKSLIRFLLNSAFSSTCKRRNTLQTRPRCSVTTRCSTSQRVPVCTTWIRFWDVHKQQQNPSNDVVAVNYPTAAEIWHVCDLILVRT